MLTGITTRTSTPQEDAELWPGGSAQPVLDYLTGTLGMTETGARELLTAARAAQAETGPGTLADYPVPGGDAPADPLRARQPGLQVQAHRPGTRSCSREPPRRKRTAARRGNAGRQPSRRGGQRLRAASPAERGGRDGAGEDHAHRLAQRGHRRAGPAHRDAGRLPARQSHGLCLRLPGRPRRPLPEAIAEEAFDTFNDHSRNPGGEELARQYYRHRLLRSLSKGDVVVVGEVPLAVASTGWTLVRGGLNEVRTDEHCTHPLPARSRLPDTADHTTHPGPDQGAT